MAAPMRLIREQRHWRRAAEANTFGNLVRGEEEEMLCADRVRDFFFT
jgi:hypothetical protein